jgi:hypothetical protein
MNPERFGEINSQEEERTPEQLAEIGNKVISAIEQTKKAITDWQEKVSNGDNSESTQQIIGSLTGRLEYLEGLAGMDNPPEMEAEQGGETVEA